MRLAVVILTSLAFTTRGNGRIMSIGSYGDDFSELDFPDDRDDCADGLCSLYANKRMIVPEKVVERRQLLQDRNFHEYNYQWKPVCGCAIHYKVINLGTGYYPQYIQTAKCKSKMCSGKCYQCTYYYHRTQVLAKRGMNSILTLDSEFDIREVEEVTIPQSLSDKWQLLSILVPVTCVAVEKP
ncbi:prothoracicotropic hormone-like [Copidosoma floridanum]|uniref:prothoracicotropic hormone-like n=1 Tax=Copidosoma floridanum TaxID=29053 RepID=UPI000C6F4FC3|nr:prothoracicotropic hormone-like [Copidosoma floridanum]